jgi:predicted RNase H-like HicB family nuclease
MATTDRSNAAPPFAEPVVRWEPAGKGIGFFVAYQPDLPGCMAQGDTAEAALASLVEARALYLKVMGERGGALPDAGADPEWPPAPPRRRPRADLQARTVRLPADVWQRLDERARGHLRSTNAETECAVRAWLEGSS